VSELDLDWNATTEEILTFIRNVVKSAGANGSVVGLSGGVDSSLVAKLLVMAIGRENVLGLILPTTFTPKEDIDDSRWLASELGIRSELIDIESSVDSLVKAMGAMHEHERSKVGIANIRSRVRMIMLYYFANLERLLVAGTGDRSEDLIGYFTKYGDGGVDFLPISHLYKTQVRKLAQFLGLPSRIAMKPSSPQLYPGHKATDEIPLDYDRLDPILKMLLDDQKPVDEVAHVTKISVEIVREVYGRFRDSVHKRTYPPMVRLW